MLSSSRPEMSAASVCTAARTAATAALLDPEPFERGVVTRVGVALRRGID
jgi:hypothetical protein